MTMTLRYEDLKHAGCGFDLGYAKWPHSGCSECGQDHPKRWRPLSISAVANLEMTRLDVWDIFTASVVLVGGADLMVGEMNGRLAKCDLSMFASSENEARQLSSRWSQYQPPSIDRYTVTDVEGYDPEPHSDRRAVAYSYTTRSVTTVTDHSQYRRGMSKAWAEDALKVAQHRDRAIKALAAWKKGIEEFAAGGGWQKLNPQAALRVFDSFAEGARPLGCDAFLRHWVDEQGLRNSIANAIEDRGWAKTPPP